jgi:hypothetical protein
VRSRTDLEANKRYDFEKDWRHPHKGAVVMTAHLLSPVNKGGHGVPLREQGRMQPHAKPIKTPVKPQ